MTPARGCAALLAQSQVKLEFLADNKAGRTVNLSFNKILRMFLFRDRFLGVEEWGFEIR